MNSIIEEWLEEGFLNFDTLEKRLEKTEKSSFPIVTDETGKFVNPKPLFTVFLDDSKLEPSFLVEYLESIKNNLRHKQSHIKTSLNKDNEISSPSSTQNKPTTIDFNRKSIFLSRKMFSFFEMADVYVSNFSPNYDTTNEKNSLYKKAVDFRNNSPEKFCDQSTQIGFHNSTEKQIETLKIDTDNKKPSVTTYLMRKYYNRKETSVAPTPKTFASYIQSRTKFLSYNDLLVKLPVYPDILEKIKTDLYVIEKTLDYNSNKNSILSYSDCKNKFEIFSSKIFSKQNVEKEHSEYREFLDPDINLRLQFHLPILKDYSVSCIQIHHLNPKIFICGYSVPSSYDMSYKPRGMILCWNIHKCSYPEKIYHMEEAVTSLEISKSKPHIVAVGMHYGLIAVIDLNENGSVSFTNHFSSLRPTSTIKSVKWVLKNYSIDEEEEILLSLSFEGIITAWNFAQTLEGTMIRSIKQQPNKDVKCFLSNTSICTYMHVKLDSPDVFSVGTINGNLYTININKPENDLQVNQCHHGCVNSVKWSNTAKNVYFTCGTDRCLHIWEFEKEKPSKTLILPDNIILISLSPTSSTLFVVLMKKQLFVYDLETNLHKPIIKLSASEDALHFSYVTFCSNSNWILVGYSSGIISLFEITNISKLNSSKSKPLRNILLSDNSN